MKVTVCLLVVLALLSIGSVWGMEREVRSYTNEMEYVDHVDTPMESTSSSSNEEDHSMIESDSSNEQHFTMMSEAEAEAEAQAEQEFGIDSSMMSSFIEQSEANDVDTDVMRAMAVEIHESAQSLLEPEDAEFVEVESESEADLDSVAELEAEVEAELEADQAPQSNDGLSPSEIAQSRQDAAADAADKKADAQDAAEEAKDKAQAQADEAKDKAEAAADAAAVAAAEAAAKKKAETPAPTPAPEPVPIRTAAPVQTTAAPQATVVQLPSDMSAAHADTIRVNEAATKTIQGALGEMGAILNQKDDTIRALVANITYLTVNIGKLANQVDLQRSYIGLLQQKLDGANAKNKELKDHVEHSADTVVSVRKQLQLVEQRLNQQDKTTQILSDFLTKNQDKVALPQLPPELEIRGTPVTRTGKRISRRWRRRRANYGNVNMKPVEGTQTYASTGAPVYEISAIPYVTSSYYGAPTPLTHPTYEPSIPTIVVEAPDNGV